MTEIAKTTRESLTLGLQYVLSADFRCFKLDSYTDMSFKETRLLSRVIGNRCRWPSPISGIKRNDQLEYTFLLSASLDTAKKNVTPKQVAYMIWEGKLLIDHRLKPVQATDTDLNGELDRVVVTENGEDKHEYQLEEGYWFKLVSEKIHEAVSMDEVREIIRPTETAYQEALVASGLAASRTNDKISISKR